MEKIFTLLLLCFLISQTLFSQTPQAFKYQAIARDDAGNNLSMWNISLRVSIIQEGVDGEAVYLETHKVQTNIFGLINIVIGDGEVEKGYFSSIKWGENRHYIKMEMDIEGGKNYKDVGTTELYAVPYALYAEQAGSVQGSSGSSSSSKSSISSKGNRTSGANSKFPADTNSFLNVNVGNVGIGTTEPQEKLDVVGKIMSTQGYNTDGDDGLSDSLNVITDLDFDNNLLQYRTVVFTGGIITGKSNKSGWVDTVDVFLKWGCGDSLLDTRDGQRYGTVKIGNQCWMAENLNVGTMINGNTGMQDNSTIEKYCYNNEPDSCSIYGALYQWNEMMQFVTTEGSQGICPVGWHIPTDDEWKTLEMALGMSQSQADATGWRGTDEGEKMKSTSGWYNNGNGTNSSGFNALPGGYRISSGSFGYLGSYGHWWSSTEHSGTNAWGRSLYYIIAQVYRFNHDETNGFSVRCIKN